MKKSIAIFLSTLIFFISLANFKTELARNLYELNKMEYEITFERIDYSAGRFFVHSSNNVINRIIRIDNDFIELPYFRYNVLLPYGKSVDNLLIQMRDEEFLGNSIWLRSGRIYTLTQNEAKCKYGSLSNTFKIENCLSKINNYYYTIQYKKGFTILTLDISPLNVVESNIIAYRKCIISIYLKDAAPNPLYRGLEDDRKEIESIVINPSIVETYPNIKNNKAEIKYLIITKENLLQPFLSLKKHKESRYISTHIETIENISSKYSGSDIQEKIRNCIKDYYMNYMTKFVLLAGDTFDSQGNAFLPHRGMFAEVDVGVLIYTKKFPCDLYYACLDGNWNTNNDDKWGDYNEEDWSAEVTVGRAPVDKLSEAWTFVNKTISFEKSTKPEKAFLHAEYDPHVFGDMSVIKKNEGGYAARGVSYYLPSNMIRDEMYEAKNYPTITVGSFSNKIVSSPLFVNHCGHGETTDYIIDGSDDIRFTRNDAMALRNTFYPIHLSVACYSGAFDGGVPNLQAIQFGGDIEGGYTSDYDCLAEDFIKNSRGGMVACVLNSRFGLGYQNDPTKLSGELDNWFYAAIYQEKLFNIGSAVQRAREKYHPIGPYDENYQAYKWVVFAFNLLGDPEMPVVSDYNPPTVQIISPSNNSFHNKNELEIEWYGEDIGSGIDHYEIIVNYSQVINVGKATIYKLQNLSEGYHSITVRAIDKFGNSASTTIYVWIDTTPPKVRVLQPHNNSIFSSRDITIKWQGDDVPTYITHYEIRIDSGMYRNIGNNTTYTVRGLSDGKHKIYIKAIDRAKNYAIVYIEIIVDTTPPEIYILSPINGTVTNSSEIVVSWRTSDYTTSIEFARVVEDSSIVYYEGRDTSCKIVLSEGIHRIEVQVVDSAGNVGISSVTVTVDKTPPKCWFSNIYEEYVHTERDLNIAWQSSDNTGIKIQKIYVDEKLVVEVDGNTFNYTIKDLRDGRHTIRIVVEDLAGNRYSTEVNIIVDTLPGGKTFWIILEIIILILVVLATLLTFIYHRRRKKSS